MLDLKVPHAEGLAGLREAMPALLVHALTFFVVGMAWVFHMYLFALKDAIGDRMIRLIMLALFFTTMLPFGARIAAEHPFGSLGAFLLTFSVLANTITIWIMAQTDMSERIKALWLRHGLDKRFKRHTSLTVGLGAACAPLCFVSAWFGYGYLLLACLQILVTRPRADIIRAEPGEAAV